MAGTVFEKGKTIYDYGQPMTALHLITSGKVEVVYPGGIYQIGKGDIIGICEICSEIHFLRYTATEDTALLTYPLTNLNSLEDLLQKLPDVARLFLLSLFRQYCILQGRYSISELNCSNLHQHLTMDYEKYNMLCQRYRLPARTLESIQDFDAYLNDDAPDIWLHAYYQGLSNIYASENYKNFVNESAVSLGILRKGSLDFRKTYQVIDDLYSYQKQLAQFYFHESNNDLFDFYTSLYYKLGQDNEDAKEILNDITRMIKQIKETSAVNTSLLDKRIQSFQSNLSMLNVSDTPTPEAAEVDSSIMAELTDSLNTILDYAGPEFDKADSFRKHIAAYKAMSDRAAMDDKSNSLRRRLTAEFNTLYSIIFQHTLETPLIPMPVKMFLYFGYVDEELAGASNAATLYSIANTMADYSTSGVYTLYNWLLAIYNGSKEPSRNEFEQDYIDTLHKLKANNNITEAQFKEKEKDAMAKVQYELDNMFPSVNKITFGRITTFCPLFSSDNVLKDLNDSYVTATKLGKIIQHIRRTDYSAYYRESLDTEHMNVMGKEIIHKEYLPDIILMPNVGIRGVMWQEIEGKKRNSSGRMMFSIFHMEDLKTTLIRLTGEFRWEMCKRIQGPRWNDVSERSLTSEYFDYIQFYRKNHDLTPEAKEKVRASLQRAKNSFKEMFVRDYIVWVLFEGSGSPRMNKVARRILFVHCPFPADICDTLASNPLYSDLLSRHKVVTAQKVHHLNMLQQKIVSGRNPIPDTLESELKYVQGIVQN